MNHKKHMHYGFWFIFLAFALVSFGFYTADGSVALTGFTSVTGNVVTVPETTEVSTDNPLYFRVNQVNGEFHYKWDGEKIHKRNHETQAFTETMDFDEGMRDIWDQSEFGAALGADEMVSYSWDGTTFTDLYDVDSNTQFAKLTSFALHPPKTGANPDIDLTKWYGTMDFIIQGQGDTQQYRFTRLEGSDAPVWQTFDGSTWNTMSWSMYEGIGVIYEDADDWVDDKVTYSVPGQEGFGSLPGVTEDLDTHEEYAEVIRFFVGNFDEQTLQRNQRLPNARNNEPYDKDIHTFVPQTGKDDAFNGLDKDGNVIWSGATKREVKAYVPNFEDNKDSYSVPEDHRSIPATVRNHDFVKGLYRNVNGFDDRILREVMKVSRQHDADPIAIMRIFNFESGQKWGTGRHQPNRADNTATGLFGLNNPTIRDFDQWRSDNELPLIGDWQGFAKKTQPQQIQIFGEYLEWRKSENLAGFTEQEIANYYKEDWRLYAAVIQPNLLDDPDMKDGNGIVFEDDDELLIGNDEGKGGNPAFLPKIDDGGVSFREMWEVVEALGTGKGISGPEEYYTIETNQGNWYFYTKSERDEFKSSLEDIPGLTINKVSKISAEERARRRVVDPVSTEPLQLYEITINGKTQVVSKTQSEINILTSNGRTKSGEEITAVKVNFEIGYVAPYSGEEPPDLPDLPDGELLPLSDARVQTALRQLGYDIEENDEASIKAAVKEFQKKHSGTGSRGLVGKKVVKAMKDELAEQKAKFDAGELQTGTWKFNYNGRDVEVNLDTGECLQNCANWNSEITKFVREKIDQEKQNARSRIEKRIRTASEGMGLSDSQISQMVTDEIDSEMGLNKEIQVDPEEVEVEFRAVSGAGFIVRDSTGKAKVFGKNDEARAIAFWEQEYAKKNKLERTKYVTDPVSGKRLFEGKDGYVILDHTNVDNPLAKVAAKTKVYEEVVVGRTQTGIQNAYYERTQENGEVGNIENVKIMNGEGTEAIITMDLFTFQDFKSIHGGGEITAGEFDGKFEFKNTKGENVEYDISNYDILGRRDIRTDRNFYFDASGNKISKAQHEALHSTGQAGKVIQYQERETDAVNKETGQVLENYKEDIKQINGQLEVVGISENLNGEIKGFNLKRVSIDETGRRTITEGRMKDDGTFDGALAEQAQKKYNQVISNRWFADFEYSFTAFKGLSGFSQLVFSEEFLNDWREGVDEVFSTFYLGTEHWTSEICSAYLPSDKSGHATIKTGDGLYDVVAHAEGEVVKRDFDGINIYKFTFMVRNPPGSNREKQGFNVFLVGQGTTQKLYENVDFIEVEEGDFFARGKGIEIDGKLTYDEEHGPPIVSESETEYNQICLQFNPPLNDARGKTVSQLCNDIVLVADYQTPYVQTETEIETQGRNPLTEAQI